MKEHTNPSPIEPTRIFVPVHLKKIGPCENPKAPTLDWSGYPIGVGSGTVSLPTGYELSGYMIRPPKIGSSLIIVRISRNGVEVPGLFRSSPVTGISGEFIHTTNSIYSLEYL